MDEAQIKIHGHYEMKWRQTLDARITNLGNLMGKYYGKKQELPYKSGGAFKYTYAHVKTMEPGSWYIPSKKFKHEIGEKFSGPDVDKLRSYRWEKIPMKSRLPSMKF